MKHTLSRVEETQPGGRRQTQREIEVKKKKKKAVKWRQDGAGGGGDCEGKQDTYKRMNASRIQYSLEQAKVKVSVVFAVV